MSYQINLRVIANSKDHMNFYSMLKFLFKKVLDKNRILLDQPIADHCFRIGTGASVKNIDFGKINSPSILIN